MATVTTPPLAATVPEGVAPEEVVLREVPWEVYCQLRDEEANDSVRMIYLDGDLTLMSPGIRHDRPSELLSQLVRAVAAGSGLTIMGIRTTTLRRRLGTTGKRGAGKEADSAFYLGANERRMRLCQDLDLNVDPPPDLALEVESTQAVTARAMEVYARLGVPEVWRFRARKWSVVIHRLQGDTYVAADRSGALPKMTSPLILAALEHYAASELDEYGWFEWTRVWAQGLPES